MNVVGNGPLKREMDNCSRKRKIISEERALNK
jgi:hypothetical protein